MRTYITRRDAAIATRDTGGAWGADVFRAMVHRSVRDLRGGRLTLRDPATGDASFGAGGELDAVVHVRDPRFYRSVALGGSVGGARAYMRGDWDASDLVSMFRMFARDRAAKHRLGGGLAAASELGYRIAHRLRGNTRRNSRRNVSAHYDLGNDFFALFLDPTMTYSAGVFETDDATMEQASLAKIDRLCRMLELGPRDHLLEIGTGWGSLAIRAAQSTGCRVTTATLSVEQAALARERIAAAGLADRIEVVVRDYRDLAGSYDKLVSVEMIEAVGHDHMEDYFRACADRLAPGGAMAIQAITVADRHYEETRRQVDVIQHMLFPGSDIPSIGSLVAAAARASDLRLVHLDDMTTGYVRTLQCWRDQFHANLDRARALGSPETLLRLWTYYLCYCEAGFAEHHLGSVQMLFRRGAR